MSDTLKAIVNFFPHWVRSGIKLWKVQPVVPYFSFSECGEDAMVLRYFKDLVGIHQGTYIDIGANSPVQGNNTMSLYLEGWTGIVVEPNPAMIAGYNRIRPNDRIMQNVASAEDDKILIFYEMEPNLVSTLNPEVVKTHQKKGYKLIRESEKVSVSLNSICASISGRVHFITIDTEGHEYEILSTFDFNLYKPIMFCIETILQDEPYLINPINILLKNGYVVYGKTGKNTLLILNEYKV